MWVLTEGSSLVNAVGLAGGGPLRRHLSQVVPGLVLWHGEPALVRCAQMLVLDSVCSSHLLLDEWHSGFRSGKRTKRQVVIVVSPTILLFLRARHSVALRKCMS